MTILLSRLHIEGLKGGEKTLEFSPDKKINIFSGPNGTGKTTVLQALHLLLRGKVPRSSGMNPASNGKDIIRLSVNQKRIFISGEWSNGIKVSREWRKEGSTVKEIINQNIDRGTRGIKEQQGLLGLYFGNVGEVWDPGQFFGMSANKMRARLMASVGARPVGDVVDMLPKNLPRTIAPGSLSTPAESWLEFAIKETDKQIKEIQAESRGYKKRIEEGNAFVKHRTESEVKAHLKTIVEKLSKAKSLDKFTDKLSHLKGRLHVLEEQVAKTEIEIESTLCARDEALAEKGSAKDNDVAAIHEEHMRVLDELKEIGAQEELKQQIEDAEEGVELCQAREVKQKILKENLKVAEQKLLTSAKEPFEKAISIAAGKECTIDLRSGGCIIKVGGVDISGLSDGESLRFIPGIVAALAFNSESKWIPLPLDRFEAISENERDQFIEGVSSLIEKGCLSQAFFAGCPDKAVESDTVSLWKTTSSDSAPEPGF